MVRSPCCERAGLKKGPWTPEEDQKLIAFIEQHGHGSWRALPAKADLQRCGKSCRLRWTNYLRPDIKRGKFSMQEEQTIIQLHALLGNRWSAIAAHLPKRTDNEIKNYWNTHLKKRLEKMGIDPMTHKPKIDAFGLSNSDPKDVANLSHITQWERARLEAEARLVRESKLLASNPIQNPQPPPPCPSSAASSTHLNRSMTRMATRPPCLDVLKAWQGVVASMFSPHGSSHESPTSIFNFSDHLESNVCAMVPSNNVGAFDNNSFDAALGSSSIKETLIQEAEGVANKEIEGGNDWICCIEGSKQIPPPQVAVLEQGLDSPMALPQAMGSTLLSNDDSWFCGANPMEGLLSDILHPSSDNVLKSSTEIGGDRVDRDHFDGLKNNTEETVGNYWNSLLSLVDEEELEQHKNERKTLEAWLR